MSRLPRPLYKFIAASGVTNLADGIASVVWAWVASLLTRDPLFIALMPIALRLPWFICALPAGIITDRTDRKRLILMMDMLRFGAFVVATFSVVSALPLLPAAQNGTDQPVLFTLLVLCALTIGTAEVFRDNAAQTMLPSLVDKEILERANGRLWSVELIGQALIGPALGAFLITTTVWLPFALNAMCYGAAILLVLRIKGGFRPKRTQSRNWKAELKEGWEFLTRHSILKTLALITGVWNLLHQMMIIALVLHVQENFGLAAWQYGLILSTGAVGGIIGGFIAEPIVKRMGNATAAQWMTLASAVSFTAIYLAPNAITLALILAAFELSGLIWNTVSVSFRQRLIPNEILGRVNSIYRMLAWGMMPIGLGLSGVIVTVAESHMSRSTALQMPFLCAALGAIVLTLFAWRPLRRGFGTS